MILTQTLSLRTKPREITINTRTLTRRLTLNPRHSLTRLRIDNTPIRTLDHRINPLILARTPLPVAHGLIVV